MDTISWKSNKKTKYSQTDWQTVITSNLFSANAVFRLPDEDILSSAQAHTWSRSVTEDCRICCHLFIWAWWNCLWICRTCAHSPAVCGRGLHRETVLNQHVCVCVCVCTATQFDHTCQLKSTSARSPACVRPVPAPRVCRRASYSEPPEQPDWRKNREDIYIQYRDLYLMVKYQWRKSVCTFFLKLKDRGSTWHRSYMQEEARKARGEREDQQGDILVCKRREKQKKWHSL